jgi:cold shock CspA family protein
MEESHGKKSRAVNEGTVKSYDATVGKGLIAREGNADVNVNRAALRDKSVQALRVGDRVRFQVMESPRGSFAFAVHRL